MFKLWVIYPAREGANFDFDYYCGKHIPAVMALLGPICKGVTVDQGVCGASRELPPIYVAATGLLFESISDIEGVFLAVATEAMADVPNFTDIEPVIQISHVRV